EPNRAPTRSRKFYHRSKNAALDLRWAKRDRIVYNSRMDLPGSLKKHFGHDEFRPLQQQIVTDALAGRDVFALMPTGGGKSLCFQLPALLRDGLTIVVSPLISLMKDQVDALR